MAFSNRIPAIIFQAVLLTLPLLGQALNQSGFISLDCGLSDNSSYTDETTGISYVSDANFTESGENRETSNINRNQTGEKQLWNLRSFPEGIRNCYTLKSAGAKGTKYLIRARFNYGNYDGEDRAPKFDLYIGVDLWKTIETAVVKNTEIIHVPNSDHVHVCLVNTDNGVPVISVLELRPLKDDIYVSETGSSLRLNGRYDFSAASYQERRYIDDAYDRLWLSLSLAGWAPLISNTLIDKKSIHKNRFGVPFTVINTAYTGNKSTTSIYIHWSNLENSQYYLYMHFAELEKLRSNQSREFNISVNGALWYGPLVPMYLRETTVYSNSSTGTASSGGNITIQLDRTEASTLPPLINAFELYDAMKLSGQETNETDVEAISSVKSVYELKKNWQGDPCSPEEYGWNGLGCNYMSGDQPTIISLNLSSSGLNGEIAPSIANLKMLQYLDLSSNNLSGAVPEFLAELAFLTVLNLKGNNLEGPLPDSLLARSKDGLTLSVDDNLIGNYTASSPGNESSSSSVTPSSPENETPSSAAYFPEKRTVYVSLFASICEVLLHFMA